MKIFGKWDPSEVEVKDPSIRNYINLAPVIVPHSGGRHARQQFNKSNLSIVERLINKVMRREENTGQKITAYKIVRDAFEIIERKTGQNPLQVLVTAITNAGPREETVRLKYGGIAVPKAVDTAPQRRVDIALKFIAEGAYQSAFSTKRSIEEALASEIIMAANYDVRCFSINRKDGKERVAKAAR